MAEEVKDEMVSVKSEENSRRVTESKIQQLGES